MFDFQVIHTIKYWNWSGWRWIATRPETGITYQGSTESAAILLLLDHEKVTEKRNSRAAS